MEWGQNWEPDISIDAFMRGEISFWRFSRLLQEVYQGKEPLGRRLTEKLLEYGHLKIPDVPSWEQEETCTVRGETEDREQIARRVRNWMHDRNLPKNREELFKICFALELDEKRAETVLGMTAESGIHFRNPRELIYAYCLRKKIEYPEAVRMVKKYWKDPVPFGGMQHREYLRKDGDREGTADLTGYIRSRFEKINSEKELEDFFRQKGGKFGLHHNTAYRKFRKMLSFLVHPAAPGDFLPDEQIYSIRKAVDQYLRMGVPYDKKSGRYTWIQREIKQHWPSAKTIYEMCARRRDVDRKTLLLLYLATEGEGEIRQEEQKSFAEHHRRMDLMLCECGMPVLNIHSPFDWLVIQAVRQENEDDFIGLRMERMIRKIYNEEKPAVYLTAEK